MAYKQITTFSYAYLVHAPYYRTCFAVFLPRDSFKCYQVFLFSIMLSIKLISSSTPLMCIPLLRTAKTDFLLRVFAFCNVHKTRIGRMEEGVHVLLEIDVTSG